MHRLIKRLSVLAVIAAMLCLGVIGMSMRTTSAISEGTANPGPSVEATTENANRPDPRVAPIIVNDLTVVCTNRPNVMVVTRFNAATGYAEYTEVISPMMCAGLSDQVPPVVPVLDVTVLPQYSPLETTTLIAFDNGRYFNLGVCTSVQGRLAVFDHQPGARNITATVYYAPAVCPPSTRT